MKQFSSQNQKIGKIGEDCAVKFLVKQGFQIIERNYTKISGEIDIIATKKNKIHFIEVKAVSYAYNPLNSKKVPRETLIRPEEQFHMKKINRFVKTIKLYKLERHVSYETDWEIDLLTVYLDMKTRNAKVIPFWNVVF